MEERDCLAGGLAPILRQLASRDPVFDRMRDGLRSLARPEAARDILEDLRTVMDR
jgi:UDP-N-acetylglucosamine:LPS N-acetylglucosamine transferase